MSTTIKSRHYYCSGRKVHWSLTTDLIYHPDYGTAVSGEETGDGTIKVWAKGFCHGHKNKTSFADLENWLLDKFNSVVLTGHSVNLKYSEGVTIYPQPM